jgi:lipopolysaccharide transport system ATP-binding protein
MYARLAFAVAAHLDSELMIIDEVLAVGDSDFQKKCISKMETVSKNEGKTLLFVSHNIASIKNLCNKSILLEKGNLINYDYTETIVDQYEKSFVINSIFEKKILKNLGLTISDVKINNLLGGKVEPFKPVLIEIEIESINETDEFAVEVLITNHLTSGLIFASNIKQHKNQKLHLKVGINKVSLRISEFLLCSGQYNLGIGINIPFVEQLFTDFNILTFNVNEIIIGDGRLSSLPAYGQVYLDHDWIIN